MPQLPSLQASDAAHLELIAAEKKLSERQKLMAKELAKARKEQEKAALKAAHDAKKEDAAAAKREAQAQAAKAAALGARGPDAKAAAFAALADKGQPSFAVRTRREAFVSHFAWRRNCPSPNDQTL